MSILPRAAAASRLAGSGPILALLAATHAVDDLYQGAVPALLPFLAAERHYTYAGLTSLTLAATFLSSAVQPAFGVITDRRRLGWLIAAGLFVAGIGIGLSGLGDSYAITWLAIALSGVGVAAYHPEATRTARGVAGNSTQAAGAVGSLTGGWLADRWRRLATIRLGYACAIPALILLAAAPDVAVAFGAAVAAGLALYLPFAVQVTLGQDYLPNRIGTASGVTLGLAISIGGLAAPLFGLLADSRGLAVSLAALAALPVASLVLASRLREPRPA